EISDGVRKGYNVGAIAVAGASAGFGPIAPTANIAVNAALNAGLNYVGSYAVNKAVGVSDSFSWREVATNMAVTAGIMGDSRTLTEVRRSAANAAVTSTWQATVREALGAFGKSVVSQGIYSGVSELITGSGTWDWQNVAINALQSAVVAGALTAPRKPNDRGRCVRQYHQPKYRRPAGAQRPLQRGERRSVSEQLCALPVPGLELPLRHRDRVRIRIRRPRRF
ncbi:MAG: hypothetical protein ACREP7_16935, partial [Lysobacter sp.]